MSGVRVLCLVALPMALLAGCQRGPGRVIRVCADPNNLPYSNQAGEGFENRIASLLAADRGASLEYTWWAQRRGFVRSTLNAASCDVVIGVPTQSDQTQTTRRYYRSSYVFVTRRGDRLDVQSFDDPRLRRLRVGVQMIGDDASNTPPAQALSNRGIIANVVGFPVFGNYAAPRPLSPIVDAVADRTLDIAVVWGPAAGFFARGRALAISPVVPDADSPSLPLAFDISMGVKHGNAALRAELDDFLNRRANDIERILADYGVPLVKDQGHATD